MYPKLYNSSDELLAVLDNIIRESAEITREVNGEFTFAFDAYEKELKSEYFDTDNYLTIENQTFDLKYIEQKHETDIVYRIECEHVFYRLHDGVANTYESYAYTGTPTEIVTDILDGTDFSIDTIDFTDSMTLAVNEEISKRDLLKELANVLGGELEFTNNGFDISILDSIGQNNGYQVRFGKNLQSVTKIIDNRGELKTYYRVDCVSLKNSNEYIRKGLQDLEVIQIGDTIKVYDEVIDLDIDNRILSLRYNPIFQVNIEIEIANKIELISDKINLIETTSVIKEQVYNGIKIGPSFGLFMERTDNTAKAYFNATEGISLYTDDGDGYEQTFGVTVGGELFLDGVINFRSGSTGIANTDAGLLATLDEVDTTTIANDSISTPKLQANAVTATNILAGAVTASKINVSYLSGIAADLGTITGGTITAVTITGANINIDEDVTIGQNLQILDPNNDVTAELTSFEILTTSGLIQSFVISEALTVNNETGEYTVDYIPFLPIFADAAQFHGDLTVNGLIQGKELIFLRRNSSEVAFCVYNNDDALGSYLGLHSGESYQSGVLRLFNGEEGDSESRFEASIDISNDSGYLKMWREDILTHDINIDSHGGYHWMYRADGKPSAYIGINAFVDNTGCIILYDDDETTPNNDVEICAVDGGVLNLNYEGSTRVSMFNTTGYGAFMYMYNEDDYKIVQLGGGVAANSCGRLDLYDETGNARAALRVSTSVGDGRLDLYSAGGSLATITFNGSNLYVTIGGTSYQIDMTA